LTTYTHGYLVAATSAFLLWRANTGRVPTADSHRNGFALGALFGAGLIWVVGVRSGLVFIEWLTLPALLLLSIRSACGAEAAHKNLFAIGYLYFAMPIWGSVNPVFQWGTILIVRGALRIFGVPSYFEGDTVQLAAGTFEIAGGCSGLHFVMVGLAVGALMGELRGGGWRDRWKLLLLAGGLAVLTNWVRVFVIILAGHYTHMQHYLVARSHYVFGWVLFAAAMTVLLLVEQRLILVATRTKPNPGPTPSESAPAAIQKILPALAVLAAMAGMQWLSARPSRERMHVPAVGAGWSKVAAPNFEWQPIIRGADVIRRLRYVSLRGDAVDRNDYLFLTQHQDKELAGYWDDVSENTIKNGMRYTKFAAISVALHDVQDSSGVHWLIAASYSVGARHVASPVKAQVHYALRSLVRLRSEAAWVTLWRSRCLPDCRTAELVLDRFVSESEF
jgi:exosortase